MVPGSLFIFNRDQTRRPLDNYIDCDLTFSLFWLGIKPATLSDHNVPRESTFNFQLTCMRDQTRYPL